MHFDNTTVLVECLIIWIHSLIRLNCIFDIDLVAERNYMFPSLWIANLECFDFILPVEYEHKRITKRTPTFSVFRVVAPYLKYFFGVEQ